MSRMPTRYPGLDDAFAGQINKVLANQPVDRDQFYQKAVAVFHRKSVGSTVGTGVTTFFTTNGTFNHSICTLPNGKSTINEPLIIREIGFAWEGITVSESAGTIALTANWYADAAVAPSANKASQFAGLIAAAQGSFVTVRQRNLVMTQMRMCDFPAGTGPNVSSVTMPLAAGAFSLTQAVQNGQNFPMSRLRLPDPLVILPDQAISVDLQFGAAWALGYETAVCCTLYGSSISRGGVGIN